MRYFRHGLFKAQSINPLFPPRCLTSLCILMFARLTQTESINIITAVLGNILPVFSHVLESWTTSVLVWNFKCFNDIMIHSLNEFHSYSLHATDDWWWCYVADSWLFSMDSAFIICKSLCSLSSPPRSINTACVPLVSALAHNFGPFEPRRSVISIIITTFTTWKIPSKRPHAARLKGDTGGRCRQLAAFKGNLSTFYKNLSTSCVSIPRSSTKVYCIYIISPVIYDSINHS